jgi:hypothetical protein
MAALNRQMFTPKIYLYFPSQDIIITIHEAAASFAVVET